MGYVYIVKVYVVIRNYFEIIWELYKDIKSSRLNFSAICWSQPVTIEMSSTEDIS